MEKTKGFWEWFKNYTKVHSKDAFWHNEGFNSWEDVENEFGNERYTETEIEEFTKYYLEKYNEFIEACSIFG